MSERDAVIAYIEAEREHFAQVARDTFAELKAVTAERDGYVAALAAERRDTTSPLLATRDALVAALRETISPGAYDAGDIADYLLASGVVRDPATLADDEALVERVGRGVRVEIHGDGAESAGDVTRSLARIYLAALAAALTEDPS